MFHDTGLSLASLKQSPLLIWEHLTFHSNSNIYAQLELIIVDESILRLDTSLFLTDTSEFRKKLMTVALRKYYLSESFETSPEQSSEAMRNGKYYFDKQNKSHCSFQGCEQVLLLFFFY